jgi:hypothetical protein
MLYVDKMFAGQVRPRVKNFKQKNDYLYVMSCPFCGDMSKGRQRTRGFFYRIDDTLNYKCHHCGDSRSFGNFLKDIAPDLYKEYSLYKYKEKKESEEFFRPILKPIIEEKTSIDLIPCIELDTHHKAIKFLLSRKIPIKQWDNFYFCPFIKNYINRLKPGTFEDEVFDHPRIVIPFYNDRKKLIGITARSLGRETPKYLITKITNDEKIFGLDKIDFNNTIYCVEGPIDSMFLPNCIAVSGASYKSNTIEHLKDNLVIIPDNDRRNKEVINQIKYAIDSNYSVVLWPDNIIEKDINDMIIAGYSSEDILTIIKMNTYKGLRAKLKFSNWIKIKLGKYDKENKNTNTYQINGRILSGSKSFC